MRMESGGVLGEKTNKTNKEPTLQCHERRLWHESSIKASNPFSNTLLFPIGLLIRTTWSSLMMT